MNNSHLLEKFHVITMVSNPLRFKTRYTNAKNFIAHMEASKVNLTMAELTFGNRDFVLTDKNNPNHLQLSTYDELWHKENILNLAVQRLPSDWEYVAWIDADVAFLRPDWAIETCHQLQHYMVVQMWQTASALGPAGQITNDQTLKSFAYCHNTNQPRQNYTSYGYPSGIAPYWHPGFAWAMRREAWDHLGGLMDYCILGAADYHMANALVGKAKESLSWNKEQKQGYNSNYVNMIMNWQKNADIYIKRDLGYVPGTITHFWHGKGKDRKYNERWRVLVEHNFDPVVDIKKDSQGIWQLNTNKWGLRDALRQYARDRNEDSIDV